MDADSDDNKKILTERTTLSRQSRDGDLHIGTSTVRVRVHSNSAANSSVSPVREHCDVLRADRVVVDDGSLSRGSFGGRDIAGSIAVGSCRRAWSVVAGCVHSRWLSASGVARRGIASGSIRCIGSFRAVGGRGIRSIWRFIRRRSIRCSRRVFSSGRVGGIRSGRSIVGGSVALRESKECEKRQEQDEETHGRSRQMWRGSVVVVSCEQLCSSKCLFAGAEGE